MATATGPRIEVIVDKQGRPSIEPKELGARCQEATSIFDNVYGDVLSSQATAEAYEPPEEVEIDIQQSDNGG